jgi:tetrathionate reductase subunit B
MKVFTFDVARCNGCYNCQIACKDEHVANDWTPYAKPQPEIGQFWLKLSEHVRGTVPKVKVAYIAHQCNHCDNARCIASCPIEGAIYKRDDGLVIIDPVKCTGCRNCVDSCPYGAIYFNQDLNIAQKCTGCAHLLDNGWKEPRCVDACPTLALKFMEESEAEAQGLIKDSEAIRPERKAADKPRTYYQHIPRKFIAGTLYDPVEKEVIVGAACTLSSNGKKRTLTTNGFGDFWFEGLDVGRYSLKIETKGFAVKTIEAISTEKDVNLGDIPLFIPFRT